MKCKQIDLGKAFCSESALDGVSKLVAKGFNVTKACEVVAEQYAENYPDEAPKSAKQLRKKFYDAQKVDKPKKKKATPKAPPMVDNTTTSCTNCFAMEVEIAALKQQLAEYADIFEAQALKEAESMKVAVPGKLPREIAFAYIAEFGNQFQRAAIKADSLPNEQMLKILKLVIEARLKKVPHSGIPKDILEAEEIV